MPQDYPSKSAPRFKLHSRWLSLENLAALCEKLDDLWTQSEQCSILFTWISFLADELFDHLKLDQNDIILNTTESNAEVKKIDSRGIKQPCSSNLLEDYDNDQLENEFQTSYFECNVCFSKKLGKDCIRFHKCEHVFCNECIKTYFETQISDGNVKALNCPQNECESQATPNQV
jgi:E3 ubiquitin-protein ligase RNF14